VGDWRGRRLGFCGGGEEEEANGNGGDGEPREGWEEGKAKREIWLWGLVAGSRRVRDLFFLPLTWEKVLTASSRQIDFLGGTTAKHVRSGRCRKHNGQMRPFVCFLWDHHEQAVFVGCLFRRTSTFCVSKYRLIHISRHINFIYI